MTIPLDDPRLTAYALGELEDESAEIEAFLSRSEEAETSADRRRAH